MGIEWFCLKFNGFTSPSRKIESNSQSCKDSIKPPLFCAVYSMLLEDMGGRTEGTTDNKFWEDFRRLLYRFHIYIDLDPNNLGSRTETIVRQGFEWNMTGFSLHSWRSPYHWIDTLAGLIHWQHQLIQSVSSHIK
jgi:hypothetical protein